MIFSFLKGVLAAIVLSLVLTQSIYAITTDVPHWVDEITHGPLKDRPQKIIEYQYRGERVYMLVAKCCDGYNRVLNFKGESVCSPSGGFSGRGDGECPDFYDQAAASGFRWNDDGKLAVTESPETLRALLLNDSKTEVERLLAAEKIVQSCDSRKECILPLAAVFEFSGSYYTLWNSVRDKLCKSGAKAAEAIPHLSSVLGDRKKHSDWRSWVFVMKTLACIGKGAAQSVPLLIDVLKHPGDDFPNYIREVAAKTLASLGTAASKSLPELKQFQDSKDADLRQAVRHAVIKISGK